jgi:hypothetical protein
LKTWPERLTGEERATAVLVITENRPVNSELAKTFRSVADMIDPAKKAAKIIPATSRANSPSEPPK